MQIDSQIRCLNCDKYIGDVKPSYDDDKIYDENIQGTFCCSNCKMQYQAEREVRHSKDIKGFKVLHYPVHFINKEALLRIPFNSQILDIQYVGRDLYIWLLVDEHVLDLEERILKVFVNLHAIDNIEGLKYIKTIQYQQNILHVFEDTKILQANRKKDKSEDYFKDTGVRLDNLGKILFKSIEELGREKDGKICDILRDSIMLLNDVITNIKSKEINKCKLEIPKLKLELSNIHENVVKEEIFPLIYDPINLLDNAGLTTTLLDICPVEDVMEESVIYHVILRFDKEEKLGVSFNFGFMDLYHELKGADFKIHLSI